MHSRGLERSWMTLVSEYEKGTVQNTVPFETFERRLLVSTIDHIGRNGTLDDTRA